MINCGSQLPICDFPIRLDNFIGCIHDCAYCFTKRKNFDISKIKSVDCSKELSEFIKGKRTGETRWADWDIPLHWGGMSDPFQHNENSTTLKLLEIFAKTKYPVIISTKGRMIFENSVLNLLQDCNVVIQISHVSPLFDKIEKNAPSYSERMDNIDKLCQMVKKRIIIRIQPYLRGCFSDVIKAIPEYSKKGIYGIVIEGMKFIGKTAELNTVRFFNDIVYEKEILEMDFKSIKKKCHENNVVFLCGENRLRSLSDNLSCCGAGDLSGFHPNKTNLNHLKFDKENFKYTDTMLKPGTATWAKTLIQSSGTYAKIEKMSYKEMMEILINSSMYNVVQ